MQMKLKKVLIFLVTFVLLIQQPAGAMAAEHGGASAGREQVKTGFADEQTGAGSADGQTKTEPADGQTGTESTDEQTGSESTGEQEDKKEINNITDGTNDAKPTPEIPDDLPDNPPQNSNDETGQEKENGKSDPVEGGEDLNEGEAEKQETEESGRSETETGTEGTETEAEEIAVTAEDEDAESEAEENRIILELPILENYGFSPFDFIMDPQGLIIKTNAVKYGGAKFEEGATLYFKNSDGDYEYSHRSDWLSITSRSNVPVCVTVELIVEETYGVDMVQDTSFPDDRSRSMYLALLDSDGNEMAVDAEGKAVLQMILPACENEEDVSICSFALTGCCNPGGDWFGMAECPRIAVDWTVEPIISEEE